MDAERLGESSNFVEMTYERSTDDALREQPLPQFHETVTRNATKEASCC